MTPRQRAEEKLCRSWRHPVGTAVVVTEDDGRETETTTRSEAWLLGGHTAVVQLADRTGGYRLSRVRVKGGAR